MTWQLRFLTQKHFLSITPLVWFINFVQSEAFAVKENNPRDNTKYINAETPPSKNTLTRQQWVRERINTSLKKCTGPLQHVLQLNWKILYALYDLCKKGGDVIVF